MGTTLDLVNYYAKLLIFQYENKPNAYNTILTSITPIVMAQQSVQTISFSPSPTSGTFVLSYSGVETSAINWNDSTATIQTQLRTIPALNQVTITGSIASGLTVNFVGLTQVAQILVAINNTLMNSSIPVKIDIEETDLTLPLAIQNAFNLDTAVGVQLDTLGKYAGVTRVVNTPSRVITLNDDDFRTLMKFAIVQNNSGSSLQQIENNLNIFFSGKFIVTDYKTMVISYIFSSTLGSADFFTALIKENLIPRPMAVGIFIIAPPVIDSFFGYSFYETGGINPNVKPYNTYEDFDNTWLYLQYQDFIF